MTNLYDEAKAYEPVQTLNIADLDEVSIKEVDILEDEGTDQKGKTFKYKFFVFNKKSYRVPNNVFEQIQMLIHYKPSVTKIKVKKSGSGLATRYKVEALD